MNKTKTFFNAIIALTLSLTSCTTTTKNEPVINPTTNPISSPATVFDIDGNGYHTVTIGTQTWLVENLKTTKYRNGNLIGTTSLANKDIASESAPKYQWPYISDETNVVTNVAKYGRLYTWYVVTDSRNIAPIGWHIPTDAEWATLEAYVSTHLGTSVSVAKALASTTDWGLYSMGPGPGNNPSINNYSGFSALPGGARPSNGTFAYIGFEGSWWSSTPDVITTFARYRYLHFGTNSMGYSRSSMSSGLSVRCVKD